jgi:hypothetical protein
MWYAFALYEEEMGNDTRRRAPYQKIEVRAELDLIDRAVRRDSRSCFVAEAIKLAAPTMTNVAVDLQVIRLTDPEKRLRFHYLTPRVCQMALIDFDQGRVPKPFGFTLNKAIRITRSRGPNRKDETPEQKHERKLAQRKEHRKINREMFASQQIDQPFSPSPELTRRVRQALDDPYAPLGPPVALAGAGASSDEGYPTIVGGVAPLYTGSRASARNPGTNVVKTRRFGIRDLTE